MDVGDGVSGHVRFRLRGCLGIGMSSRQDLGGSVGMSQDLGSSKLPWTGHRMICFGPYYIVFVWVVVDTRVDHPTGQL